MDHYEIWCNLKDTHKDMEFVAAVQAYLGALKSRGRIADFHLKRRKLGFGPRDLGEFNISIIAENLAQLENAFDLIAERRGEIDRLHAAVYSRTADFQSALYRD